jgi:hypothetical protein
MDASATFGGSTEQRQNHDHRHHQNHIHLQGQSGTYPQLGSDDQGYEDGGTDIPGKLSMENEQPFYAHQMLGVLTNEIVNASTEWFNMSSSTESPDGMDENGYVPYTERLETYIVPVLFAIIFIIGILGNGVLILIFLRHRTMRNVPNM